MMNLLAPDAEQLNELILWRAQALETMPYMAATILSLRVLNAPGLGTFAVDAHHRLYIDFAAVIPKGLDWCSESLLHECGHIFGVHADRATEASVAPGERNVWNFAGDFEINDDLDAAGCHTLGRGGDGLLASKFGLEDFNTAEFYLAELRKLQPPQPSPPPNGNGQGAPGNGQPGDNPQPGTTGTEPFSGCGSGSGGLAAPGELDPGDDAGGLAPAATDAEKLRVRIATAQNIKDAASSGRGTVPAGLIETADAVLAPSKLPWRTLLSAAVRRAVAMRQGDFDITFSRRNRRRSTVEIAPGQRAMYPGTFSPTPTLAVVRDTSGSMSLDELASVGIEIEGIAKQIGVRGRDLKVLDVDAAVGSVRSYQGPTSIQEITGRGGTDMCLGIDEAIALRPTPNAVVVVTDGFTPWPAVRTRIPLVVCLVGPGAEQAKASVPEWAVAVVVDDI